MDKIFDIVSDFLSRPRGFVTVHILMLVGLVLPTDIYTMALSVFAISMAAFLLVSGYKGNLALHLKLDEMIKASAASNKVIREEQKSIKEIEKDIDDDNGDQ